MLKCGNKTALRAAERLRGRNAGADLLLVLMYLVSVQLAANLHLLRVG